VSVLTLKTWNGQGIRNKSGKVRNVWVLQNVALVDLSIVLLVIVGT